LAAGAGGGWWGVFRGRWKFKSYSTTSGRGSMLVF
jgi:hypothetical protein